MYAGPAFTFAANVDIKAAIKPARSIPRIPVGMKFDKANGRIRRFSKRVSKEIVRRSSSVQEALPETPAGWTVLLSAVGAAVLGYEIRSTSLIGRRL